MNHRDGARPTASGSSIYYQRWLPGHGAPSAIVAVVHGFGEYTDLYRGVAEVLVTSGCGVYAMDLRGHGRSPGARGFIREWGDYREDLSAMLDLIGQEEGQAPLFLLGNSMGGLVVIEYALRHPGQVRGVIAMSPALGKLGVAPFLLALSRLLSKVWPSFSLDSGMDSEAMTRDKTVVARLEADPMVHGRGSARLGTEVLNTIARVRSQAEQLAVPILIQHGDADTITDPADSRWFFERIAHQDKELLLYPGSYHNLCVDLNWREVLRDNAQWIGRHLGA